SRRWSQGAQIEYDVFDGARRDLGIWYAVGGAASNGRVEQVLHDEVRRQPHVERVGCDGLVEQVDGDGFLAEAADVLAIDGQEPAARCRITRNEGLERDDLRDEVRRIDELHAAGDAVAVDVVRIGEREEGAIVDGLEQAETGDTWRREARDAGG